MIPNGPGVITRPMSTGAARSQNRRACISAGATRSEEQEGHARCEGDVMHPMFVKLYLEPEADDDREDRRRRSNRARRLQSRAQARVRQTGGHEDAGQR